MSKRKRGFVINSEGELLLGDESLNVGGGDERLRASE